MSRHDCGLLAVCACGVAGIAAGVVRIDPALILSGSLLVLWAVWWGREVRHGR